MTARGSATRTPGRPDRKNVTAEAASPLAKASDHVRVLSQANSATLPIPIGLSIVPWL